MTWRPIPLKCGCNGSFVCNEGKRLWKAEQVTYKEYKKTGNYKPYKLAFTENQKHYQLNH
jgi:hypothetical protein